MWLHIDTVRVGRVDFFLWKGFYTNNFFYWPYRLAKVSYTLLTKFVLFWITLEIKTNATAVFWQFLLVSKLYWLYRFWLYRSAKISPILLKFRYICFYHLLLTKRHHVFEWDIQEAFFGTVQGETAVKTNKGEDKYQQREVAIKWPIGIKRALHSWGHFYWVPYFILSMWQQPNWKKNILH